ncbi:MAG: VWA domain-containing protein [Desulfovibrio sp.]|nr:VWA domain-containing protein [Desulfovibrio sp.]
MPPFFSSPDSPFPFGSLASSNNAAASIALKAVTVKGEVRGLLFSSVIQQEYHNTSEQNLEVIYTFPMAWDTVLLGMTATLGEKTLTAQLVEKNEAETQYEKAIEKGDSAILVQKSAKGLYTANLGNIKAGEKIVIALHCARLLKFEQRRIRISIPTVISERFGDPHADGGLALHESVQTDARTRYAFSAEIALLGDIARAKVSCPSHPVQAESVPDGLLFCLAEGALLDRDFVLLVEELNVPSLAQYVTLDGQTLVLASFAPEVEQGQISPLALKLLVDCSGSMQGERIMQARQGLEAIVQALLPEDYVALGCFGSTMLQKTAMLPADAQGLERLKAAMAKIQADMGGTQMCGALQASFRLAAPEGMAAHVLLITDGDVWDIERIVQTAKRSGQRVFAIGVGSAPSESLLRELAEQTAGACEFVTPGESMADAVPRMFARMRGSLAGNVSIDWHGHCQWQSLTPQFLYDGETVHAFALMDEVPAEPPVLRWQSGGVEHEVKAQSLERLESSDIFRLGMQRRLEESLDGKEQRRLALTYQLVSDYTSLILVIQRNEDDKCHALPSVQQVPQMQAHGHGLAFSNCLASAAGALKGCLKGFGRAAVEARSASVSEDVCACVDESEPFETSETAKIELLRALLRQWQSHVLSQNLVSAVLSKILQADALPGITELVEKLRSTCHLDDEVLLAAMMRWVFEKTATAEDRHSRRLLGRALQNVASESLQQMRALCEEWFVQA